VNCHSWISCCSRTNVFFLVLVAYASVLVLVLRVNVLVLVLRVNVLVLVLVLIVTVLLTSLSLVYHNNCLNSTLTNNVIYSHLLVLLAILVSSLKKICRLPKYAVSKSCLHNIRDLRRIRNTIDQTILHAPLLLLSFILKLNIVTLLLNLPATQTNRLQLVLNSAVRAVTKTPKFHHITPILESLHWFKINERIKYKLLSVTYKFLKTGEPSHLRFLLSFPLHRSTRSSPITLSHPSLTTRLQIANRS